MAEAIVWKSNDRVIVKKVLINVPCIGSPYAYAKCKIEVSDLGTVDVKSEYLNNGIIDIVIGEADSELDRGIERCVCTMRRGEESSAEINLNATDKCVQTTIRLIDFTNDAPVYEWSDSRRLSKALHHKQRGVTLFTGHRPQDAFFRFSRAVKLLITIGLMDPSIQSHYIALCNNMALCQLMRDNTAHALELCHKVLSKRPDNVKALLRRAEANSRLGHTENAVEDLVCATQLEPANTVAIQKLGVARRKLQHEQLDYVNIVKRMFQF